MIQTSALITQHVCHCKDFPGRKESALKSVALFEGSPLGGVSQGGGTRGMPTVKCCRLAPQPRGGGGEMLPWVPQGRVSRLGLLLGVRTPVVYSSQCVPTKTVGFNCKIQQP